MKTPFGKLFEAMDYYRAWRDEIVKDTAVKYLKKNYPNHPLLKDWIEKELPYGGREITKIKQNKQ